MNSRHIFALLGIICLLVISNGKPRNRVREVFNLNDLKICPDIKFSPYSRSNVSVTYKGKSNYKANLHFELDKEISNTSGFFEIQRCLGRDLKDCEKILSFLIDDLCEFFNTKGTWDNIFKTVQPNLKCPLKGLYVIDNLDFNMIVPVLKGFIQVDGHEDSSYYYDVFFKVLSGKDNIFCAQTNGNFVKTRT